uniref:Uncharacterized protein n=1 Tax=Solanum tuberosum TaxID=4113 RepID=M1A933_SOLTU
MTSESSSIKTELRPRCRQVSPNFTAWCLTELLQQYQGEPQVEPNQIFFNSVLSRAVSIEWRLPKAELSSQLFNLFFP